jgi:hypothetical protein
MKGVLKVMGIYQVPVTKGKTTIEVDDIALSDDVMREVILQGLKVLMNRGTSKITKEAYPDPEEMKAAAVKAAEVQAEALKAGKIKFSGSAKVKKASGAVMTEARRIARNMVKDSMKEQGLKISHFEASEITAAANALLEADPTIVETAKVALEERAKKPIAIDIKSLVKESPKLVQKALDKKSKAKADAPLSKTQAGKTQPRAKGQQPTSQATH